MNLGGARSKPKGMGCLGIEIWPLCLATSARIGSGGVDRAGQFDDRGFCLLRLPE